MSAVDFEREGLLEGVDSEQERAARVELLQQFIEEGVPLEDLREAASEDRLALLPVELVFTRDCQYSIGQVAEKAGLSEEFLRRDQQALGLPQPDREEQFFSEADVEGAMTVRSLLDAGVPRKTCSNSRASPARGPRGWPRRCSGYSRRSSCVPVTPSVISACAMRMWQCDSRR